MIRCYECDAELLFAEGFAHEEGHVYCLRCRSPDDYDPDELGLDPEEEYHA